MSNVIEDLSTPHREIIIQIIGAANPPLLAKLQSAQNPTRDQQEVAEDILYSEFVKNLQPGHEPNERGVLISSAINAFANWFIDHGHEIPS